MGKSRRRLVLSASAAQRLPREYRLLVTAVNLKINHQFWHIIYKAHAVSVGLYFIQLNRQINRDTAEYAPRHLHRNFVFPEYPYPLPNADKAHPAPLCH